jgi:hypothetical protein
MRSNYEANLRIALALVFLALSTLIVLLSQGFSPRLAPDSYTYLEFDVRRTFGYPLILRAFTSFEQGLYLLVFFQLILLQYSIIYSAGILARFNFSNTSIAIFYLFGLNPVILDYSGRVLTESLLISINTITFFYFVSCYAEDTLTKTRILLVSVLIFLGIQINPIAYYTVPLYCIGILAHPKHPMRHRAALASLLVSLIGVFILVTSSVNYWARGVFSTQSFAGFNLVLQVSPMIPELRQGPEQLQKVHQIIANSNKDIDKLLFHTEDLSFTEFHIMHMLNYNKFASEVYAGSVEEVYGQRVRDDFSKLNQISWEIAMNTIKHAPVEYFKTVLVSYWALWTLPVITSSVEMKNIIARLEDIGAAGHFNSSEIDFLADLRHKLPSGLDLVKNYVLTCMMFLNIVIIFFSYRLRHTDAGFLIALASLGLFGHHLLIAIFETALPRYALQGFWALGVVVVAGTELLIRKFKN